VLHIIGTSGSITLRTPWLPTIDGSMTTVITVDRPRRRAEKIKVTAGKPLYAYQADLVAECVARGERQATTPAPSWDDTLANMRTLDRWRQAVGVSYAADAR
jgi:predicted dehydrogenase